MGALGLTLLLAAADPDPGLTKKMLPIYLKEAEGYSLAVESAPKARLALKPEPVFEWLNPTRNGGQHGAVFLWLHDGRPAALACVFSHPHEKLPGRSLLHELHALDPEKLVVKREAFNQWEPQAGLARKELTDAPTPAATPAARLVQLKRLAQEFTGSESGPEGKRLELRLLPTPLYRYPAATTGVIDGALFALKSETGTDPEVLLLVEAREEKGKTRWEYALGRFSDQALYVQRNGKEVWTSVRDDKTSTPAHDALHLYRLYPEKVVTPEGKVLAHYRQTPERVWGILIPVEDK